MAGDISIEQMQRILGHLPGVGIVICQKQVPYVGQVLTQEGVRPDPSRIQAIVDMLVPDDKASQKKPMDWSSYHRNRRPTGL